MDLCQVFDQELEALEIETVQKETIHPRSTRLHLSPHSVRGRRGVWTSCLTCAARACRCPNPQSRTR
jgi:hypothetical protein